VYRNTINSQLTGKISLKLDSSWLLKSGRKQKKLIAAIFLGQCRYENYEGKYLEHKLDLSQYKQAERFKPKLNPPKENIPEHLRSKIPPPAPPRYTFVDSYADAEELCELLQPDCQGIQAEMNSKFSLRGEGIPRDFVVTVPDKPYHLRNGKSVLDPSVPKHYMFPAKAAYLRYCPGDSGNVQKFEKVIPVDLTKDRTKAQHRYQFEIRFRVSHQALSIAYNS